VRLTFLVCCDSAIIDLTTNALSIINIIEDMQTPGFPFVLGRLDASKNYSRIGGELIQSVVSEEERGHGGTDARVFRC